MFMSLLLLTGSTPELELQELAFVRGTFGDLRILFPNKYELKGSWFINKGPIFVQFLPILSNKMGAREARNYIL